MNYEEFKAKVLDRLKEDFPEGEIVVRKVLKNNDQCMEALTIREGDDNISPTLYLDQIYPAVEAGQEFEEAYLNLKEAYRQNRVEGSVDVSFIEDYQNVKDNVIYDLVSLDKNMKLLEDVPYDTYLDLAIVYRVLLKINDKGGSTMLIHNEHLKMWGICQEELRKDAIKNTPLLLPPVIENLSNLLMGMAEDMGQGDAELPELPMYVLTNETHMNGAGCIVYHDVLKDFADEMEEDLYILPSSIHEVLLVPASVGTDLSALSELVEEVNDKEVEDAEILSGHAYFYSRQKGQVLS